MRRRVLIGTYVLSAGYYDAYYLKAQKVRTLIKRDFDDGVRNGRRGADADDAGPRLRHRREVRAIRSQMYLERHLHGDGEHGRPAGHLGAGRPVVARARRSGLQLIGKPFDEATLFRAGQVIEDAAGRFIVPDRWWEAGNSGKAAAPKSRKAKVKEV